jgi:protease-4
MSEKKPRSFSFFGGCLTGCLTAIFIPVILIVLCALCVEFVFKDQTQGFTRSLDAASCKQQGQYVYTWRWGDGTSNDPKVARLYLKGVIEEEEPQVFSFLLEDRKVYEHSLVAKINHVTNNDSIDGIWLEIDSPGGEVSLSDEIYHSLCCFRESRPGRFVFVYFKSQACSGGYYIALAGDRIMSGPVAWTGSIGVIVSSFNLSKLAENIGVQGLNVASSGNKALLDPLQPVNTNHVAIVQKVVDQTYERFIALVSERRKLPLEEIKPIADGRILSAQDALSHKLIDAIGYEEDALEEVVRLAKKFNPNASGVRIYSVESAEMFFRFPFPVMGESQVLSEIIRRRAKIESANRMFDKPCMK